MAGPPDQGPGSASASERPPSRASQSAAVFRHEVRILAGASLTYVFLAGFLLALAACIFLIADFYATDEASIRPLLVFLPWVGMVFVPALAMRAWHDGGPADTGQELLLTLPLRVGSIVTGKFLAGYCLLLLTLAFTFPFALSVIYLGEPDPGALACGYLGAALMLGASYAVALLVASLTREQTGAFVAALVALFVLTLLGWDVLARALQSRLTAGVLDTLTYLSPKTWLDALGRGVIDLPGVGYFALVGGLALTGTRAVIDSRRRRARHAGAVVRRLLAGFGGIALLAGAMHVLVRVPAALDLTAEREFTLHAGTRSVIAGVPAPTRIALYWSETETSVPTAIRSHAHRTRALLQEMVRAGAGRLTLESHDPQPDTDTELQAGALGMQRVAMSSGDHFYLGATFRNGERIARIPYFDIRRARLTEYDIALALNSLAQADVPRLAVVSPLLAPTTAQRDREGMSFMSELRKAYDVAVVPYFASELPPEVDVVLLIQPVILQKRMLYALDQFLMAGGRVIAMLDPHVRFERGANSARFQPSTAVDDLSDLLARYGIGYTPARVVGDATLATTVSTPDGGSLAFPFWLRVPATGLSDAHPVTASLNELLFAEAGELHIEPGSQAQALIDTSARSGLLGAESFAQLDPERLSAAFEPDGKRRTLAVVRGGRFDSAFAAAPDGAPAHGHRSSSQPGALLFVIADTDWLFDPWAVQSVPVGGQHIVRPLNDNLALLLNLIEYAAGDPALLAIRSRGRLQRPFTRVAALLAEAQERYRAQESALVERLAALERQAESAGLGPSDPGYLASQRALLPLRRELRATRRLIRESVVRLGERLTLINLLAGPILAAALWAVAGRRRRTHPPTTLTG